MKVMVLPPAYYIPDGLDKNGYLDIPEGENVGYVLKKMKMPKIKARIMLVSVNGQIATATTALHEGDTIGFFSGLAGG